MSFSASFARWNGDDAETGAADLLTTVRIYRCIVGYPYPILVPYGLPVFLQERREGPKPDEREQAERELNSRVSKLLGHSLANDADFNAAEDQIKAEALKRGFHVLLGRTQPLRELMIWKKQSVEQRQVNLAEGPQRVRVTYLDDFLLYS